MADEQKIDMMEIMTREEFESWLRRMVGERMKEIGAGENSNLVMPLAEWMAMVGGLVVDLGVGTVSVQDLEEVVQDLEEIAEVTGEGGPPYDAATRTGMYDHDDVL
jgi:hypothetical protein